MRRSKLEIYIQILKAIASKKSVNISCILRRANVNFNQSRAYLDFLLFDDLIARTNLTREVVYSITPKGMRLLGAFLKIEKALKLEKEPLTAFLFERVK